jgi:hypothetical protein
MWRVDRSGGLPFVPAISSRFARMVAGRAS